MKRAVLVALASLGIAAGLAVTASSTTAQAYASGMRGIALAAIVVVLEVTNVLGTFVLLTDARRWACWQAGGLVALASLVTGWCGVLTYSWVGLVGPVFVLGGVHLARLAATAPAMLTPPGGVQPAPTLAEGADPAMLPGTYERFDAEAWDSERSEREGEPSIAALVDPPTSPTFAQGAPDEVIVAALLARDELPGRDAVKAEFRCGTKKAERVLAQAAEQRRPHLVAAQEATS